EGRISGDGAAQQRVAEDEVPGLLGEDWQADLTPFQRRDIAQLLSLSHGANFSVPGAGKTRVAWALYAARREEGRVRRAPVVPRQSAFESWSGEAEQCRASPPQLAVADGEPEISAAEVVAVNSARLPKMKPALAAWRAAVPSMVILDEAHRMKLG